MGETSSLQLCECTLLCLDDTFWFLRNIPPFFLISSCNEKIIKVWPFKWPILIFSIFSVITLFLSKVALTFGFGKLWQGSLYLLWFLTGQLYEHHLWWITYIYVCVYIYMYIYSSVSHCFLAPDLLGGDCWHTIWTLGCAFSFLGFLWGWSANQDLFTFNPVYCLKRNLPAPWPFLACFTAG